MGKKRGTKPGSSFRKPKALNRADGRLKKWDKLSDIPMDEEDQFHASRDKILIAGDEGEDEDGYDDEVFALNGVSDEDEDEYGMDVDEDIDGNGMDYEEKSSSQNAAKSKKKKSKGKSNVASSESEEFSESEEEESWGKSKSAYYSSNAAQLESDDEEGNELEEQEARRLQAKMRQDMTDDDFGLNDPIDLTIDAESIDVLAEPRPQAVQQLPLDNASLIRHFERTDPESLALARDWTDTAQSLVKTKEKIARTESKTPDALSLGMMHLYYQALLTYASTLTFYIHLRAKEKYARHPELLKTHPIMSRLLTLKESITTLEDLDFGNSDSGSNESDFDLDNLDDDIMLDAEKLWVRDRHPKLQAELAELLRDANADHPTLQVRPLQAPALSSESGSRPKKKRKTTKYEPLRNDDPVFDLVEPEFTPSQTSSSRQPVDIADAFGEVTSLQHVDAADKSARRKSLRFHTSKIESTSLRRKGARNSTVGGDDDIPYRERRKEKGKRTVEEAQARLAKQGGEDLDGIDPEPKNAVDMSVDDPETEDADGYYELVKKKARDKKEKRKAEHEARTTRIDYDDDDATGPRSLTRAILKNKGLTPHRPKSVRNPRVKKRQKFDKAKKKIASQKAVYKGGDSGRYEGERSGISKVVKSVRLS
ncbi:Sas10 C-terminal domain-containing protein [Armillaria fumosa]|nr:Sas10 C-terminal domain-containing protein [Armillaria fumosa]